MVDINSTVFSDALTCCFRRFESISLGEKVINAILQRYRIWKNKCRQCHVDGISIELLNYYKNLSFIGQTKGCSEYVCSNCNTLWTLAEKSKMLLKVIRHDVYDMWKTTALIPSHDQQQILTKIIGVPDANGINVYYPCCVSIGGATHQKTILIATLGGVFGKFPYNRELLPLDESYVIQESNYALPFEVRLAAMMAEEKSMGFAPTNVVDNNAKKYTLYSQMNFVDFNGIQGMDLSLDNNAPHKKNLIYPESADLYLFCDAFATIKTAKKCI